MTPPAAISENSRSPKMSTSRPGLLRNHSRTSSIGLERETILVSNMHCSSCVRTIEESLSTLSPTPTNVEVSIVSQSVTLHLPDGLSLESVATALDESGFDVVFEHPPASSASNVRTRMALVRKASKFSNYFTKKQQKHADQCLICGPDPQSHAHGVDASAGHPGMEPPTSAVSSPPKPADTGASLNEAYIIGSSPRNPQILHELTMSISGMTCASCATSITRALGDVPGVQDININPLSHSGTCKVSSKAITDQVIEAVEDCGFEAQLLTFKPLDIPTEPPRKSGATPSARSGPAALTLSIGGMTCVSCSNAITEALGAVPGVTDVHVDLLGNSATLVVESDSIVSKVIETIEDIGYEGEVAEKRVLGESPSDTQRRIISLKVEGMFCKHCPENVMAALAPLVSQGKVKLLKSLTYPTTDVLEIEYAPSTPDFTIRSIIEAIATSKPSETSKFDVKIYKPPTLEERAKAMYQHEQRSLLYRLIFAVIVAIPTFILGIVYMSLVPHDDATRMWLMSPMWAGRASRTEWALFLLATPVMFYSCGLFHRRSIKELRALWRKGSRVPVWYRFVRFGSMNLLVSAGVTVAYVSSIVLLAMAAAQKPMNMPGVFMAGDTTTYFDSVVFLAMFLLMGRYLEAYSKSKTADAITTLAKLRPSKALLLVPHDMASNFSTPDDVEKGNPMNEVSGTLRSHALVEIDAELLEAGDVVRVPHGSTPPADGIVFNRAGKLEAAVTSFDESSLTGESRPVSKHHGDEVFLGTINKGAAVDVKIKTVGEGNMLDQIIKVVREGQTNRAPIERVADRVTAYFVPIITLLAILTWVVWLALGLGGVLPRSYVDIEVGGWPIWSLEFAIAVFVVACPCGIGLAAPTALLVGSGMAAKFGILARGGGEAFQEMAQVDVIAFDKTGTLTEGGAPQVTDAEIIIDVSQAENDEKRAYASRSSILGIADALESASSHPLATAIRSYCQSSGDAAAPVSATDFEEVSGRGLKALLPNYGITAIIGNESWMTEHGVTMNDDIRTKLNGWKNEAKSVVLLALQPANGAAFALAATFAIADTIRKEAREVIRDLQNQGTAVWMISGDNSTTAKAVARAVGIDESHVIADVLPHEKAQKVQWLQETRQKRGTPWLRKTFRQQEMNPRSVVAFIGDGINDSPALTVADVGIAMGSGSDVALSSASFVLLSSDLGGVLTLSTLSRKVLRRVKLNFLWALVYNVVALPVAAGVVYPAGHARLAPVWASLAMALSSVSVVCSSLLLKIWTPPRRSKADTNH